jgi:hypothetical protein
VLADIESGEHDPGVSVRAMLADLYGVSPAWLRGARPVVPQSATVLLSMTGRFTSDDIDAITEVIGAIYTPERR